MKINYLNLKNHLNFDLYEKVLFNNTTIRCSQQGFKSDYHITYTQTIQIIKEFNHLIGLLHILMVWIKNLLIN